MEIPEGVSPGEIVAAIPHRKTVDDPRCPGSSRTVVVANHQMTIKKPSDDHQIATNKKEKKAKNLKEREEVTFSSIKEAVAVFEAKGEFSDLNIKNSLSEMVRKEGWALTESNCRHWLSIEKGCRKRPFAPKIKTEDRPEGAETEKYGEPGPEMAEAFNALKRNTDFRSVTDCTGRPRQGNRQSHYSAIASNH